MIGTDQAPKLTFGLPPVPAVTIAVLQFTLAIGLGTVLARAQPITATERGRMLFTSGRHADGSPVRATNVDTGVSLPPTFVACENCHGYDARGKTEAGVTVSDIRWDTLTKPYPVPRSDGRPRAPYGPALFFRAITTGRDSRGQSLSSTMPRFQLSEAEAADIATYLASIDAADDQGVSASVIWLGLASPATPSASSASPHPVQWLENWANSVNGHGGVFSRHVEWVRLDDADAVGRSPVLAVVMLDGANESVANACARRAVPCVRVTAAIDATPNPREFAFRPSRPSRVLNLLHYAVRHDAAAPSAIAVLIPKTMSADESAAIRAAVRTQSITNLVAVEPSTSDRVRTALEANSIRDVVVAGPTEDFTELLLTTARSRWRPRFLFTDELTASAASLKGLNMADLECGIGSDVSDAAMAEFVPASGSGQTVGTDSAACSVMATVRLLAIALDRAGRAINRDKLIDTLESLQDVRTGFAPPAGFTPTRHIAAGGSYIVSTSPHGPVSAPEWIPAIPGS